MSGKLPLLLRLPLATCLTQARQTEEFSLPPAPSGSRLSNMRLYVDPASGNCDGLPKADLVIVTDIHPDHFAPATIDRVKMDSTLILAPEAVSKTLTAAQETVVYQSQQAAKQLEKDSIGPPRLSRLNTKIIEQRTGGT